MQTARLARFPALRVPALETDLPAVFPCLGNRTTFRPAEHINRPRFALLLRLWVVHTSERCFNGQIKLLNCATAISHWCFELSSKDARWTPASLLAKVMEETSFRHFSREANVPAKLNDD